MMYVVRHKHSRRKLWYIVGSIIAVLVVVFLVLGTQKKAEQDPHLIIVLSPHYDDAVLSLGGFMAKREHPTLVATFFTAGPAVATSTSWDEMSGFTSSLDASVARAKENTEALKILGALPFDYSYFDNQYRNPRVDNLELEQDLAKDIQALLASYSDRIVDIYGPAIFTPDITHPDHALLHRAYLDVEKNYPQKNVTFYIYEDYPYVERYSKSNFSSLEKNLEKDSGLLFDKVDYSISSPDLRRKESALEAYVSQIKAFNALKVAIVSDDINYTKSRCSQACEVAYKIFRVTE